MQKPEGSSHRYKEGTSTPSYSKRGSMTNGITDNNGNEVPSVSEIRKRFDPKMTVTKLPTNENKYSSKTSVDQYLSQLKNCENGTTGYTKILPRDEKPVPVHLPSIEKNGLSKWDANSLTSKLNSNSDQSISKTISEPVSLAKPEVEKINEMSVSLTAKLPSDRIASIRSQLDPNNPIGKILEKSTVIQVENGDTDYGEHKRYSKTGSDGIKAKESLKNDIEKQVKTPKHTSNFASYIQISQPISSGTSSPKSKIEINGFKDDEIISDDHKEPKRKTKLKYIDSEIDDNSSILDNDVESPSGTGFENKTFEHESYLMKRGVDEVDKAKINRSEIIVNGDDDVKPMDTSTESTASDVTGDSSPDTPSARRKVMDNYEDIKSVSNVFIKCIFCVRPIS